MLRRIYLKLNCFLDYLKIKKLDRIVKKCDKKLFKSKNNEWLFRKRRAEQEAAGLSRITYYSAKNLRMQWILDRLDYIPDLGRVK